MIEMPVTPGTNPSKLLGLDFTDHDDWLDNISVPPIGLVSVNNANLDPRNDHGVANPTNPNSRNYTNYNPTQGRKDLM